MEATTIPQEELEEINKTQGFELASSTPEEASNRCIAYDVEDIPPWYQCLLFGLQVGVKKSHSEYISLGY